MKRIIFGVLTATLAVLVIAVPVIAAYWAYLVIEETNGTTYSDLPVLASRNITQLVDYGIISSTGLDTRVLTGDGDVLPHMLADDRVCVVSDLGDNEKKQLIFYTGATSLSSFPIIVGYGGNISTPDVDELEMGYVTEVIVTGYFNASAGTDKNILYKEDSFIVSINGANNLSVEALNVSDVQWEMHYSNFTSGVHTVYIVCNGLHAFLYVDTFDVAKDSANLFDSSQTLISGTTSTTVTDRRRQSFYSQGLYWAFYIASSPNITFQTSSDGVSWSGATVIEAASQTDSNKGFSVWENGDNIYIAYTAYRSYLGGGEQDKIRYRTGALETNGTITWGAAWSDAMTGVFALNEACITTTSAANPAIAYRYGAQQIRGLIFGVSDTQVNTNANLHGETTITGYPNSDKLFVVWSTYKGYAYPVLTGRYWNGAGWGGSVETIDSEQSAYDVSQFSAIADDDDNVYIVWVANGAIYLRIRYADGTWGDKTLVAASGSYPTVSYNDVNDCIYICYISGNYVYAIAIAAGELTSSGVIFTPASTAAGVIAASPLGEHIGIIYQSTTDNTLHAYVDFFWDWNENSNDWYWMMNNSMAYADLLEIAVDGTLHCHYEPQDIIHSDTIPDLSPATGNDGTINWGENPSGVSAYITSIYTDEGVPPPIAPSPTNGTAPGDMVGPTGQPGNSQSLPELPSHPLYPLLAPLAALSGIPLGIMWILFATFFVVMAMIVFYRYVPHLLMMVFVGGGLSAFFYAMGIFPFWVLIIFVIGALAVVIAEREHSIG